jgi:hypothetical protein
MNMMLMEIGTLARRTHCVVDMRRDGRIILKRDKKALTSALHPLAAKAWLRREQQHYAESTAKARLARLAKLERSAR